MIALNTLNNLSIAKPLPFEFGNALSTIGNDYARFWDILDTVTVTSFYVYTHKNFFGNGNRET
jgi:hypothetical protein